MSMAIILLSTISVASLSFLLYQQLLKRREERIRGGAGVGLAYMLLGEAGADQHDISAKAPPKGKDWYYSRRLASGSSRARRATSRQHDRLSAAT